MKITILIGGHRSIELPLSDEELNFQMRQMGMTDRIEGNMFWFMKKRSKNSIWKKSGRNMDGRFPKTLRDMPWLSRTL